MVGLLTVIVGEVLTVTVDDPDVVHVPIEPIIEYIVVIVGLAVTVEVLELLKVADGLQV